MKEINGYEIRYNPMWKTFQVSHKEIGACIAEFDSITDAKEYCERG